MKPVLKLAMLQSMADNLPLCAGAQHTSILFRVFMVCSRTEHEVLSLHWQNREHVALLQFLKASLPPETYQWVRGHLRFDGVPPAVLDTLNM